MWTKVDVLGLSQTVEEFSELSKSWKVILIA